MMSCHPLLLSLLRALERKRLDMCSQSDLYCQSELRTSRKRGQTRHNIYNLFITIHALLHIEITPRNGGAGRQSQRLGRKAEFETNLIFTQVLQFPLNTPLQGLISQAIIQVIARISNELKLQNLLFLCVTERCFIGVSSFGLSAPKQVPERSTSKEG